MDTKNKVPVRTIEHLFHYRTVALACVAALISAIVVAINPFVGVVVGVGIVMTGMCGVLWPRWMRIWRLSVPMGLIDGLWWVVVGATVIAMGFAAMNGVPFQALMSR